MKTKIPTDDSTYCAFLQAMYKYSRLPNLTHHRSTYARRLKLVQSHIFLKTGRLHPIRRLIDHTTVFKSKDSPAKPGTSETIKESQNPQAEAEVSPQVAPPTTAHSTDPADYNHTVFSAPGISRRRLKLAIPTMQLPPFPAFDHRPSFSDSRSKLQAHSLLNPLSQANISPSLPYTPVDQIIHTPLLPPEMPRFPKEKTNLLSPHTPQDPSSPLFHPLDTLRPRNASAHPRPLLCPRQLSYFHSIPTVSDSTSTSKVGGTLDASPGAPPTESLASPLILFQPNSPYGLERSF